MANFNTHLLGAAVAGVAISTVYVKARVVGIADVPLFFMLVLVGGILPDIDAKKSRPAKLLFKILASLSALATVLALQGRFQIQNLLLLGVGVHLLVRYPVFALFNALTMHRGIIHSLLAAAFFALLLVCGGHHLLGWPPRRAWLAGASLSVGFIVHLVLDEIYSVDLANKRMKKSFGTALKLYHYDNLLLSSLLGASAWVLYSQTPPLQGLLQTIHSVHWGELLTSLAPCLSPSNMLNEGRGAFR